MWSEFTDRFGDDSWIRDMEENDRYSEYSEEMHDWAQSQENDAEDGWWYGDD